MFQILRESPKSLLQSPTLLHLQNLNRLIANVTLNNDTMAKSQKRKLLSKGLASSHPVKKQLLVQTSGVTKKRKMTNPNKIEVGKPTIVNQKIMSYPKNANVGKAARSIAAENRRQARREKLEYLRKVVEEGMATESELAEYSTTLARLDSEQRSRTKNSEKQKVENEIARAFKESTQKSVASQINEDTNMQEAVQPANTTSFATDFLPKSTQASYQGLGQGLWPTQKRVSTRLNPAAQSFSYQSLPLRPAHNSAMPDLSTLSLEHSNVIPYRSSMPDRPGADGSSNREFQTGSKHTKPRGKKQNEAMSNPTPIPSPLYLAQTKLAPVQLDTPQPLLIILDLNGTLIQRTRMTTRFLRRPGLGPFLQNLLTSSTVLIWTSARPHNMDTILNELLTPAQRSTLVATWARDTLGLRPEQYNSKVQVFKDLHRVWSDEAVQARHPHFGSGARWSQTNTLLIDDSALKAAAQPHNLIHVPELTPARRIIEADNPLLAQINAYIQWAARWSDVSALVRAKPFRVAMAPTLTAEGKAKVKLAMQTSREETPDLVVADVEEPSEAEGTGV